MFVVMDYADQKGFSYAGADVEIANYERADALMMGSWVPFLERRGFPDMAGQNVLDILYEKIREAGKDVDYICLGPLTNLACLIFTHPDVTGYIRKIVVCPGEQLQSTRYPMSESHILKDPVAARIVMNAEPVKAVIAEEGMKAQYSGLQRYLSVPEACQPEPDVFVTAVLEGACTYGSLCIDRLNICKRKPNAVLIGGYYDGKDSSDH